ncbi:MAG: hypothetical protein K0Q49_962 [Haloplasmataceae bacterium]|jgi:hypothetical protein|nr:hypothetical protein [Haloplasmataceae bacterium]
MVICKSLVYNGCESLQRREITPRLSSTFGNDAVKLSEREDKSIQPKVKPETIELRNIIKFQVLYYVVRYT